MSLHPDQWSLQTDRGDLDLDPQTSTEMAFWRNLANAGVDMNGPAIRDLPTDRRLRLRVLVDACERRGFLLRQLLVGGEAVASRRVISRAFTVEDVDPLSPHRLSRFVVCRPSDDGLLLESPLSLARILLLSDRAAGTLFALQRGVPDLTALGEDFEPFAVMLVETGLLVPVDGSGRTKEERNDALSQWSFHDLLFHARSRFGRHDDAFGGTYPFADSGRPPPDRLREPVSGQTLPLGRPDLEALKESDRPFTAVLESRRSVRTARGTPLTRDVLGEFLYRTSRLQSPSDPSYRPSPSGGALHELELYLVVRECEGIDPGLYRYSPVDHDLEVLPSPAEPRAELLRFSGDPPPAVHIIMAARFPLVTWKYSSMPYAVILKNVGCLMQTMYLVATAMDLAPCAIGAGDADLFARLTGLPYEAEGSVGEFSLY